MRLLGSHFVLGQTIEEALVARPRPRRIPLFVRHARRRRAHRRRRRALFRRLCRRDRGHRRRTPAMRRCRAGPASRSSCRRCIRATRRSRASACCDELDAARHRARPHGARRTISISRSMPRRPTGWSCRSRSSRAVLGDPRSPAGTASASPCRPIRSARRRDRLGRGCGGGSDRRLMVRLVKGAYWDTEIKRAQERGLADYPVFTRKAMTDLCYMACAKTLLAARPRLFPQFATHNALTVASVIEDAGGVDGLRVPAPARHGRGALRRAARRAAATPPAASMRRSAATAICSPIWCGGCWRTAPTPRSCRSPPIRTCRSQTSCAGRKARSPARVQARNPQNPAAARSLSAGAAQLGGHRVRRARQRSKRLLAEVRAGARAARTPRR